MSESKEKATPVCPQVRHWYLISFFADTKGSASAQVRGNLTVGLVNKNINETVLDDVRRQVSKDYSDPVILSISYLGAMTKEEFFSKEGNGND